MNNNEQKILMICESPNKVKTLRQFLPSNYTVMASVGHISEIKNGGSYWNTGIEPEDNFKANYGVSSEKKDVVASLKRAVDSASKVVIASDPDREGEAIAWSLKKFLKIPDSKYERVTFHEITKTAVLKALENPRKIDDDLVDAAQTRQKLDKMMGYRLSPVARRAIGAKSVGRCQSAGLKLIVQREEEIQAFKVETFYDLYAYFKKNNTQFKAKYKGTATKSVDSFKSLDEAKKVMDECDPPFFISNVSKKEKLEYPKPPFTTSTFQQEVSSRLGIGVKQAMQYAQKLFEGMNVNGKHVALITYIRTDSNELAPEFLPLLEDFVKSEYGNKYYAPVRKAKQQENAQEGHEAIRPVDLSMTPEKLSGYIEDQRLLKVYDIIYKRTVATSMTPSKVSETTYTLSSKNGQLFGFVSKEQLFDGFKKAYAYDTADDNDDVETKITFIKDEPIKVDYIEPQEKHTNPPKRYKEASFIKELETTGIGRPSTFATIVSTLTDSVRGYCKEEDKCIVPTELGIQLSHYLDKTFPNLINVGYTGEMETSLDKIANGKMTENSFLKSFYDKMESSIPKSSSSKSSEHTDEKCPICGAPMVVRTGKYGKFLGCSRYPKCKGIKKLS